MDVKANMQHGLKARVAHRAFGIAALMAALASQATAQRGTGTVRDTASAAPLPGAVVSALDSLRHPLGHAVADAAGRYSIELSGNATELRVQRIGFQPRFVPLPRSRPALFTLDVSLSQVATLLAAVTVNDERVCSADQKRAGALSLWEQARAGLLAAVVARDANPAQATTMSYRRLVEIGTNRVLREVDEQRTGATRRPFQADSPAELAEKGYLWTDATGDVLKAPDADVLLDDSFADTHCFGATPADSAHPGAIGLTFEPAKGREKLVDVRGTLWIESAVPALRSLVFTYTDPRNMLARNGAGGTMTFHTMPNGVAFIEEYMLTSPVVERTGGVRAGRVVVQGTTQIKQRSETGGIVLSASWPDGQKFTSPLNAVTGTVTERGTLAPIRGIVVGLESDGRTFETDSAGRFSMSPVLPGRYVMQVVDTTLAGFVAPRTKSTEIEVRGGQAVDLQVEMEGKTELLKALCKGFDFSPATTTIISRIVDSLGDGTVPKNLRVMAEWIQGGSKTQHETQTVSLDQDGRFSVCAVPRDREVFLAVSREGGVSAATTFHTVPDGPVQSFEWIVGFHTLATATPPKLATFRGRVVRGDSKTGVANADIWLPTLDKHASTDSSGAFRIEGLPAGQALVQVRNVSFNPQRDTVTLGTGVDVVRNYTLFPRAQQLDTVRTFATQNAVMSPGLRGFEERAKTKTSGYIISDSTLRAHDNDPLSSIILSRVSGIQLVPAQGGATYVASSRKQCAGRAFAICSGPTCFVTTYIDGVLTYMAGGASGEPTDVQRFLVSDLAGVEYYPAGGNGPPEYNGTSTSGCGTLLLWTRER